MDDPIARQLTLDGLRADSREAVVPPGWPPTLVLPCQGKLCVHGDSCFADPLSGLFDFTLPGLDGFGVFASVLVCGYYSRVRFFVPPESPLVAEVNGIRFTGGMESDVLRSGSSLCLGGSDSPDAVGRTYILFCSQGIARHPGSPLLVRSDQVGNYMEIDKDWWEGLEPNVGGRDS